MIRGEGFMAINIVIADKHEEYVRRLTSYIKKNYGDTYEIETFNSQTDLVKRISKGKCEILLVSPGLYDPALYLKNIKLPVVLLGEEPFQPVDKMKWQISKYTRISSLLTYLDEKLEEVERNRPIVYGVFSPAGGVGKSTMALAAALAYVQQGKKVLYVNLEEMDGTGMFFEEKPTIPKEVANKKQEDQYDAFLSTGILQDPQSKIMYLKRDLLGMHQQTREVLALLIERMIDQELANIVMIDFGTASSELSEELLSNVDYLLLVSNAQTHAVYKLSQWLEQMYAKEEIKEKVRLIINEAKEVKLPVEIEVVGQVDKLYATHPLGICDYIAQHQFLRLHGLE